MARLRDWLRGPRGRAESEAPRAAVPDSSIWAGVDELIALRLQAQGLKLSPGRTVGSAAAGGHGSRFRGRGMDYQESRSYQPGDDIRNMDWRVTARADRPYVKLYEEERERPVVLLLDLNPGMFFGTRGALKSVVGARIAALIGWATITNGDRIGALLFNGGHREIQPRGGRSGVLRLIRALVQETNPERGMQGVWQSEALNEALQRTRRVARPGSLVFIVSDFYAANDSTRRHLVRLRQHCDVMAIQVVDPLEVSVPRPGLYGITNGTDRELLDTRSARTRAEYVHYFDQHHSFVRHLLQAAIIPLLRISTTDPVVPALSRFLSNPLLAREVA